MSYRQSSYDPLAVQPGPVLKPYNGWQWLGVVMTFGGMILIALSLAAIFGWAPRGFNATPGGFVMMGIGGLLVESRRAPGEPVSEAELRRNARRFLLTILAGVAIAAGILLIAHAQGDF